VRTSDHVTRLLAATACSGDGRPIGPVTAVYFDEETGRPAWVGVRAGPADGLERLVPLARSWLHPGPQLVVSVTRRAVEEAPVAPGPELGAEDEDELYRYYAQAISPMRGAPAVARRLTGTGLVRLRRHGAPDQSLAV
jgi:hypothetical protein